MGGRNAFSAVNIIRRSAPPPCSLKISPFPTASHNLLPAPARSPDPLIETVGGQGREAEQAIPPLGLRWIRSSMFPTIPPSSPSLSLRRACSLILGCMRGCVDRCVAIAWRGCCVIMLRRCVYQVKAVRVVWDRYVVGLFPDFWIWIWWQRPGFNLLEFAVNMLLLVCCMLMNQVATPPLGDLVSLCVQRIYCSLIFAVDWKRENYKNPLTFIGGGGHIPTYQYFCFSQPHVSNT
jgi:hypothetical protein